MKSGQGPYCKDLDLCRGLNAKPRDLFVKPKLKFYKINIKLYKNYKNANSAVLDSIKLVLQLLLHDNAQFLNIFYCKIKVRVNSS
jgi:hypothetical protein